MGQLLVHWDTLLKLLENLLSHNNLSIFKRDQNSAGFEQYRAQFTIGILSINRNCKREFKPIIFVVVPYFAGSTFPELPANSFCNGAPRRVAHYWSRFGTYCRVQYLFFHASTKIELTFPGNAGCISQFFINVDEIFSLLIFIALISFSIAHEIIHSKHGRRNRKEEKFLTTTDNYRSSMSDIVRSGKAWIDGLECG